MNTTKSNIPNDNDEDSMMSEYFFPVLSMIAYFLLLRKMLQPRKPKKPSEKKNK